MAHLPTSLLDYLISTSLKPIKSDKLNPIKDLRPVCPNCHAMLHQKKPAYSIEELKAIIKQAAQ
jgi:predicted HNH restriction endonuclease